MTHVVQGRTCNSSIYSVGIHQELLVKFSYNLHKTLFDIRLLSNLSTIQRLPQHEQRVVVATTCQNDTCSMLTSAKLTEGYLVVGITRELNKELLLYCSSIYIDTMWSMLQQYLPALMSMHRPHVLLLIHHKCCRLKTLELVMRLNLIPG